MTRYLLLSDNFLFVDVGRLPWREDGSVFYNVQYIYILHVILRYSFTNLTYLPHTHTHTHTHICAFFNPLSLCDSVSPEPYYAESYILPTRTTHRKHTSSSIMCVSVGVPMWSLPSTPLARWLLSSNGPDANDIENTTPVLLAAYLFERAYLARGFSGSKA
jgi:hypothetical protein